MKNENDLEKNNRILVLIDGSYFMYYTIFGAVNTYQTKCKLEANMLIKSPEETDQTNLPDLLVSSEFKKYLKRSIVNRCEVVNWILKENFQDQLDMADAIDIIFALDDTASKSFRKQIFPEYKAQRKLTKKSYDIFKIKNYIVDVIFPELNISNKFNYNLAFVDGAEGDDVIACTLNNHQEYMLRVLFASDKDFQQLENVHQYDLRGSEVKTKISYKKEEIVLSPKEALLLKILTGDSSDNIPAIASRMGNVSAYKLINDKEKLKLTLIENQDAAKQFATNKKIIDFNLIPEELKNKINDKISIILNNIRKNDNLNVNNIELMEL